jgi:hypothetical protein
MIEDNMTEGEGQPGKHESRKNVISITDIADKRTK